MNKLEKLQMDAITSAEFNPEDKTPNYLGFAQKSGELTIDIAIKFAEWLVELLPPEYTMDVRRRYTSQVKLPNENELAWIETHKYSSSNPRFYTTQELFEEFINTHYGK
jgi:hypothetical protein